MGPWPFSSVVAEVVAHGESLAGASFAGTIHPGFSAKPAAPGPASLPPPLRLAVCTGPCGLLGIWELEALAKFEEFSNYGDLKSGVGTGREGRTHSLVPSPWGISAHCTSQPGQGHVARGMWHVGSAYC